MEILLKFDLHLANIGKKSKSKQDGSECRVCSMTNNDNWEIEAMEGSNDRQCPMMSSEIDWKYTPLKGHTNKVVSG